MIEFGQVSFKYNKTADFVLKNISFKVEKNEFVAIIGKNAAGKTTLVKHINGLLKPSQGIVKIDGKDISKIPLSKMATFVGLAFQNPNHQLFASSVFKELEFGPKNLGLNKETRKEEIEKIVNTFQIEHLLERSPLELSGGERRLVSIASVLTMNQQILVLDEPTYGQDYLQKKRLGEFLKNLITSGITILIVSHDMDFILDFVPRVIVLSQGEIIADGPTKEILLNEEIISKADLVPPVLLHLCHSLKELDVDFPISMDENVIYTSIQRIFTSHQGDVH